MQRPLISVVTVPLFLFAAAPAFADDDEPRIAIAEVNPWTHLDLANDPDAFQFAIVTDRTGGERPGVFTDAIRRLNLLQPEFVMSVGDLIEGSADRDIVDAEWDEFVRFVEALEMPFFYVPGNHDIGNQVMADVWRERFGRTYYSFVYRDVLFVCLDTEWPIPTRVTTAQIAWLKDELAAHKDVRWTLVFMHKPLWAYVDFETDKLRDTGWRQVEQALRGRKHTVFAGHWHSYTKYIRNDSRYFILATTGGGSSLRGPMYGQFDHVVWVTMTDSGPRIANLLLDGIWDEDIRTESVARKLEQLIHDRVVRVARSCTTPSGLRRARPRFGSPTMPTCPLRLSAASTRRTCLLPRPTRSEL